MSERNSTPSPISGSRLDDDYDDLNADLDLGFDGAADILRVWRSGMRPDPDLTVSEWADAHRKLSSRASAEPGQYRTSRTPYARPEWQKMRERNEALDTRVYARAAAWIMGADRWDEATWRRLEAQAGVETRASVAPALAAVPFAGLATEPDTPAPPKAGTPTTPRRKRRAYTPTFMRD